MWHLTSGCFHVHACQARPCWSAVSTSTLFGAQPWSVVGPGRVSPATAVAAASLPPYDFMELLQLDSRFSASGSGDKTRALSAQNRPVVASRLREGGAMGGAPQTRMSPRGPRVSPPAGCVSSSKGERKALQTCTLAGGFSSNRFIETRSTFPNIHRFLVRNSVAFRTLTVSRHRHHYLVPEGTLCPPSSDWL